MQSDGIVTAASQQFWYVMYGFIVRSDVLLPLPHRRELVGATPAWVIRRMGVDQTPPEPDGPIVARIEDQDGTLRTTVHRGPSGTFVWNQSVGTCYISSDARQVDVYPDPGAHERRLQLLLAGQISAFVLRGLGYPTLHASGIITPYGAIAFLGPPGGGKSTMAACFMRNGAQLLTDDIMPLHLITEHGIYAGVGLPYMKLWPPALTQTFGISDDLPPVLSGFDKKLLSLEGRFAVASRPSRLRACYVLSPRAGDAESEDVTITNISGQELLMTLITQTSFGELLQPEELARLFPVYADLARQAPVRVLSFPSGFELQDGVYAKVMEDLAERADA